MDRKPTVSRTARVRRDWSQCHAGPGVQGHEDGRTHGQRASNGAELKVLRVDAERNLLLVEGSVPGPNNGTLLIKRGEGSGVLVRPLSAMTHWSENNDAS